MPYFHFKWTDHINSYVVIMHFIDTSTSIMYVKTTNENMKSFEPYFRSFQKFRRFHCQFFIATCMFCTIQRSNGNTDREREKEFVKSWCRKCDWTNVLSEPIRFFFAAGLCCWYQLKASFWRWRRVSVYSCSVARPRFKPNSRQSQSGVKPGQVLIPEKPLVFALLLISKSKFW